MHGLIVKYILSENFKFLYTFFLELLGNIAFFAVF